MKTRKLIAIALAAILPTTVALADFPEKPVNYVIPFGPGGESDITARHQQPYFKKMFGEDLVISYKPGGGGAVGWSQLNQMIQQLKEAVENNHFSQIRRILQTAVSGYQPQCGIMDEVTQAMDNKTVKQVSNVIQI